jgi:hypothetical protein
MSISSLIGAIVPTELSSLFSGEKEEKKVFKKLVFLFKFVGRNFQEKKKKF